MSTQPNPLDTSQYVLTYVNATKYYAQRDNHRIEEDFKVKVSNWKMGYRPGTPPPAIPNIVILDEQKLNEYFSRMAKGDLDPRTGIYEYASTLAPLPVNQDDLLPPDSGSAKMPVPASPVGNEDGDQDRRLAAIGVDLNDLTSGLRWPEGGVTWEWRRRANPFNRLDGRWHRVG